MQPRLPSNRILCCDCVTEMQALPNLCIPLTVTSPPYDDLRLYGGHPFDFAKFQAVAHELYRVTMPGGVLVWVVRDAIVDGGETGTSARQKLYFQEVGFTLYNTIVMVRKGNHLPGNVRYGTAPEQAFVLTKGRPRTVNIIRDKPNSTAGGPLKKYSRNRDGSMTVIRYPNKVTSLLGQRSNVWVYDAGWNKSTKDKIAFQHPALMPEAMARDLIVSWSRPGDLIFDPMAGAGTTCKMALLNHRRYLGMEIFAEYAELARERLGMAYEQYRKGLSRWLFGSQVVGKLCFGGTPSSIASPGLALGSLTET
jgi:DNA modification methylase